MSLKERIREHQREIRREISRIDRQVLKLQEQRKRLMRTCKMNFTKGETSAGQALVKQILQGDKQIKVFQNLKLNCTAMSHQLDTVHSTVQLQRTLKQSVKVMAAASRMTPLATSDKNVSEYMRRLEDNESIMEYMGEACQTTFGDEDENLELEKKIYEELEVELKVSLPQTPSLDPSIETMLPTRDRVQVPVSLPIPLLVNELKPAPTARKPFEDKEKVYDGVAAALEKRLNDLSKFPKSI